MDAAYVILNEQVWKINDPLANTYFIKIDDQTRFIVVALLVIRTTQNRRFSAGTSRKAWKGHSQPRNARIVVTAQKMKVLVKLMLSFWKYRFSNNNLIGYSATWSRC